MYFLYNLIVLLLTPLWLILLKQKQKEYLKLKERLGFAPISKESPVWIHAVSLGEVKLAIRLANILISKGYNIFMTSSTKAGLMQLEKQGFAHAAFPIDLALFQKIALSRIKPAAAVFVETEIWPSLLNCLKKNGIPSFIANGRLSDKRLSKYLTFKNFFKSALSGCWISASSEENADRFISLGLDPARVVSQTNLKFDIAVRQEAPEGETLNQLSEFIPGEPPPVWIGGSIREGEEEIILSVHSALKNKINTVRLIIAPRHLERVGKILEICWDQGFKPKLRTEFPEKEWDVLILDSYGELQSAYRLADVAFIGGSLLNYGGQNPLEPAGSGTSMIFGPHMENFQEEAKALLEGGAAIKVEDNEQLTRKLTGLLTDNEMRENMKRNALKIIDNSSGSTARTVDWIVEKM
mgnify:CR=1 FL=1